VKLCLKILLIPTLFALASCGNKNNEDHLNVKHFLLLPFTDQVRESSSDYEKLKSLPPVIDLSDFMTTVKNQGDRNTCSYFATIALVESAIKRKMKIEVDLSEEYLNYAAKTEGRASHTEEGSFTDGLIVSLKNRGGFLLEQDWPYSSSWFKKIEPCLEFANTDKDSPVECFSHYSPPLKILAKKLPADHFKGFAMELSSANDIVKALANRKEPFSIFVPINYKGWGRDGNVKYDEELRNECLKDSAGCGQHIIVLTGYDLEKKVLFFKNSWGKEWGNEGYGKIPFDYVDKYAYPLQLFVNLESPIELPKF